MNGSGTVSMRFPAQETLTLLNLATPTLSKRSAFVDKVKKMTEEENLLKIERLCFTTDLPATVALPISVREKSVVLTAAFFILTSKKDTLKRKQIDYVLSQIAEVSQGRVETIMEDLLESNYDVELCTTYFSAYPEEAALAFLVLTLYANSGVRPEYVQNMWDGCNRSIHLMVDETCEEASAYAKKHCGFVGSRKNIKDYFRLCFEEEELFNPKKTLSTIPLVLFSKAVLGAGVNPFVLFGDGLVSKEESEIAGRCAVLGQSQSVKFDFEGYRKEFVEMPEARSDYHKAYMIALMVRKVAMAHAKDVLTELEKKMFGTEESQIAFDKQLEALDLAQKKVCSLEKENRELQEKISSIDKWKESVRKREYALKEQISNLQKQLDAAKERADTGDAFSNDDTEAPFNIETALQEAEFDDIKSENEADNQRELAEYKRKYRIVVVGGNENLMKRFHTMHPEIVLLNDSRRGSCNATIKNADFIFFKTDSISHSMYEKCKNLVQNNKNLYGYLPETTSITTIEQVICEKIREKSGLKKGGDSDA